MQIGVPREIKDMEFRVGMVPDGVRQLADAGHELLVERGAGEGSGFPDGAYAQAGARLVDAEEVFGAPDLIVKVKEPQPPEILHMRSGQTLFTYLHLAASPDLAEALRAADIVAIAYETIQNLDGSFPVLAPMSEVAGRLAVQIGVTLLQKDRGGKGLLLGGVPGVDVLDVDLSRLTYLYDIFSGDLNTLFSNPANITRSVTSSDLVIGAVYVRGKRAPVLVTEAMVKSMQPGSVVADVAVDQGGCVETIHATTHSDPTYVVHDVIHYGVANMPGAVPRTSTFALTNTTLPFVEHMAAAGVVDAIRESPALAMGVNVWRGEIVCDGVSESLDLPRRDLEEFLGGDGG
jgi:alanine dehydrogenase